MLPKPTEAMFSAAEASGDLSDIREAFVDLHEQAEDLEARVKDLEADLRALRHSARPKRERAPGLIERYGRKAVAQVRRDLRACGVEGPGAVRTECEKRLLNDLLMSER
jgi:chromosome segregation ATPase